MNVEIGLDVIEIDRFKKLIYNDRFLNRIFTAREIEHIKSKETDIGRLSTVSGLFAAKEAISKAMGTGISGFKWSDIEINHDRKGKPVVRFHNGAKDIIGEKKTEVSISHSRKTAIAQAVIYNLRKSIPSENKGYISLPKRKRDTHKGDYGKLAVIGGSTGMTGAPCLTSFSALRTGSGLVYTLVPKEIYEIAANKSLENIVVPIDDSEKGHFTSSSIEGINNIKYKFNTIALGPGMGRDEESADFVKEIISIGYPMVIDADALNLVSENKSVLNLNNRIVLTPHSAEFSRLIGKTVEEVDSNRVFYAEQFVNDYDVILVLKGRNTIVADKSNIYINRTGNPGMATAGSGDVLTGVIASLIGQGFGIFDAAKFGVYIHGLAGDIAAEDLGEYGIIAGDIVDNLPFAIESCVEGR